MHFCYDRHSSQPLICEQCKSDDLICTPKRATNSFWRKMVIFAVIACLIIVPATSLTLIRTNLDITSGLLWGGLIFISIPLAFLIFTAVNLKKAESKPINFIQCNKCNYSWYEKNPIKPKTSK